jgi:hypothetical protein
MDWDGAEEAARRLKALMPPQVLLASQAQATPEQIALMRQAEQAQAAAQPAAQHAAELASQERIEALKSATELRKAEIEAALRAGERAAGLPTEPTQPSGGFHRVG